MHTRAPASASLTPTSLPVCGETLADRYRLERELGQGTSAVVYRAFDLSLQRPVAVKVLRPESAASTRRERFVREARILASLSHPNVVSVHDFIEDLARPFLVMEIVEGATLSAELARGPLSAERTLSLLLPVMGALAYVHDRGVVHRDLKPSNIVFEPRNGLLRPKLLDFGVARWLDGNTRPGAMLGTPGYMAPEQIAAREIGPYTDVWAFGVILFRCLAGRAPFEGDSGDALLRRIATQPPPSLREFCPALGLRLGLAIDRALQPNRALRYTDMRLFVRSLVTACLQDGIALPHDPDPLGLPNFGQWVAEVDLRDTARFDLRTVARGARPALRRTRADLEPEPVWTPRLAAEEDQIDVGEELLPRSASGLWARRPVLVGALLGVVAATGAWFLQGAAVTEPLDSRAGRTEQRGIPQPKPARTEPTGGSAPMVTPLVSPSSEKREDVVELALVDRPVRKRTRTPPRSELSRPCTTLAPLRGESVMQGDGPAPTFDPFKKLDEVESPPSELLEDYAVLE